MTIGNVHVKLRVICSAVLVTIATSYQSCCQNVRSILFSLPLSLAHSYILSFYVPSDEYIILELLAESLEKGTLRT